MPSGTNFSNGSIRLGGTVDTYFTNDAGHAIMIRCTAANLPSAVAGYAVGCLAEATDTGAAYFNTGSTSSATFTLVGTVTALSVGTAQLAANGVTLAKLASGITPSHVVKYAGKVTWSGSGASKAATVSGVLSTDIVTATIQTAPSQAAYLVSVAPTTDTVTSTLSAANTSNDAVIAYQVLRAAS